jgi:hypothetical protein
MGRGAGGCKHLYDVLFSSVFSLVQGGCKRSITVTSVGGSEGDGGQGGRTDGPPALLVQPWTTNKSQAQASWRGAGGRGRGEGRGRTFFLCGARTPKSTN